MGWQFWIDRGGTFTDVIALRPDGTLTGTKLLSENPRAYQDSAVEGMRRILKLGPDDGFPHDDVDVIKMGTTVATNALLERKGTPTVLAITRGFADALVIGSQHRPKLFDLHIERPAPLYSATIEIGERVRADGQLETPLDEGGARRDLEDAFKQGFRSIAIALVHADRFPEHEKRLGKIARDIGFTQISTSHEVIPLMRLIGRGDTTVADAYLSPVLRRYVDQVTRLTEGSRILFMQSNGGLTDGNVFRGKDAVLSGPAGGIVGMAGIASRAGFDKVIGFDMGGTSTDVSHYAGIYERTHDSMVAGVRLRAPMMSIHTVAAGGGSQCIFDGLRFRVGPESAGASPGPACYRQGGPLTITDCNVLLGRIQPDYFPKVFGDHSRDAIDRGAAESLFKELASRVRDARGSSPGIEELAEGFLALAIENMANAIKTISVQRGYDVSSYTLVSFGGAGGQHACAVADALGMDRVLIHPYAGVLSAYGMGLADLRVLKQQTVALPLNEGSFGAIADICEALTRDAEQGLLDQNVAPDEITSVSTLLVRYEGSDTTLDVPAGDLERARGAFNEKHNQLFGFVQTEKSLIVEAISAEAIGGGSTLAAEPLPEAVTREVGSTRARVWVAGAWQEIDVYIRAELTIDESVTGPCLIVEANSTTFVESGWRATCTPRRDLLITRAEARTEHTAIGTGANPITVEIFNSLFMAIAEQMGATLQNTAHSVNIKERLDFSCAVFDGAGALVANAPHMPVHLGSMGESVRAIMRAHKRQMKPGDVYVTNAPYNGGTHLPDVTVVMPVYIDRHTQPTLFVAARGHHADIGGISPGSMPSGSTSIDQEGVLFDAVKVASDGQFLEKDVRAILLKSAYPARNPEQNIADLRAQIAACVKGARELQKMVDQFGYDTVVAYTQHVQDNAEEAVRRVISALDSGSFTAPLDEGGQVCVSISIDRDKREAHVDFSGTSEQRPTNYNAPSAVTRAAVLYVFRTLVDDDIPMNEGCLKPIRISIPAGCMLDPAYPAAVVAGNVETSQIVCDAMYGALGRLAGSQGTMNNLTFGNEEYQYYETICGGSGAGADFDGTDAVQTHMTNSRLTDVEVLEWRYPVIVDGFSIRRDSGGTGCHHGGNGAVRRIRFLENMDVSILSGRRTTEPHGLSGGEPGKAGRTWLERNGGGIESLAFSDRAHAMAGDVIVVETPGGGGFGKPS